MASKVSGVIEKINVSGTERAIASTAYGYCETAASTAAKVVDMTDFKLHEGVTIHVKFKEKNSAASPTLNVQGTGAKPIVQYGTTAASTADETSGWYAGAVLTLTYDGTSWVRDQGFNTNTNTWRGVENSLTSDSTSVSLSAAQGKVLKGLIDAMDATTPAASGNATAFIDSITQTDGKITSITKKNIPTVSSSTAGLAPKGAAVSTQSTSTRFLREDGEWAAPSYIANTDTKVAQSSNSEDKEFPILFKNTDNTTKETAGVKYSGNVTADATTTKPFTFNPSTGNLTVTQLKIGTKNDNMGLFPILNNWNQIGSSSLYWYRSYINNYYGSRSHVDNWDSGKNIGTAATASAAATKGTVNFYNSAAANATQTKTLLEANANASSNLTITLPSSTGTLALTSQIPTNLNQLTNGPGYVTSSGITSVTIGATSPVQSSTSTTQSGSSASTTISLKDAYGDTKNPYGTKAKNLVLAGPSSGSNAAPTFRALVAADIPSLAYVPATGGVNDVNTLVNTGVYNITSGSATNTPKGYGYGQLLVMSYRKHTGNTTTDWASQLYLHNGGGTASGSASAPGNVLYYRTGNSASSNTWFDWQKAVHVDDTYTKVGDTNKPVYIAADGTAIPISYEINKSVPSDAVFTDHYAWGDITSKPDTATRWPKWNEIAAGADALPEGTSNWTDNTEILTSYASNNGFADSASKGVVYRRDALCAYNYIKGKLDSVYAAKATTLSGYGITDAIKTVTSIDNAVVRFDGASGQIQNSGVIVDDNNNISVSSILLNLYSGYNLCKLQTSASGTEIVIKTRFKFVNSTTMPSIRIHGYSYGKGAPLDLTIVYYIYSNEFYVPKVISTGGISPDIYLFTYTEDSIKYVAIGIKSSLGYLGFTVDANGGALGGLNINSDSILCTTGWTIEHNGSNTSNTLIPAVNTDNCKLVPYIALSTTVEKTISANLTSTTNAVAYYTNTTGTFGSKASANGALYATSANGALQWGTLPIAQGGTGKTNAADAWTALGGGASGKHADSYFALASHNHAASDINSGTLDLARIPTITNAKLANSKVTIAGNVVNLGESLSDSILRESLGLSKALRFIGVTTTDMTGGTATNHSWTGTPAGISNYTPKQGDVVINSTKQDEWVCTSVSGTTYTWERLGSDTSYKIVQSAVSDPTASTTTSTTFIDTISQNANGVITATKKTLPTASSTVAGITKVGASGGAATYSHTHTISLTQTGTSTVNLAANTVYTLTAGGSSVVFKTPADGNTDTKVTQAYSTNNAIYPILMTATAGNTSTSSRGDTTAILNNSIYANPSTGQLNATTYKVNEAVILKYNPGDSSLEFVF